MAKVSNRIPRSNSEKICMTVMFFVFFLYTLTILFPLVWTFYNSLKGAREFNNNQFALPLDPKWDNYLYTFTTEFPGNITIPFAVFNTIWMTAGSTIVGGFCAVMTAYAIAKYKFKGANLIYTIAIFTMIIPIVGSLPSSYEINWNILQIADKPWIWWVTWTSGFGFSFLMYYSAWKNTSWTYAEAAFIDGASNMRVFLTIMLPMVKPIIIALCVVNFIGGWTDYMTSYLWMPSYPTLGYAIFYLQQRAAYMGLPIYFSIIVTSMIPSVILFMIFQETIMQNMTTGGLKG